MFVTHDIDEALLLGDQIVILKQGGEIAQRGTGAEILTSPADAFVSQFLGIDHGGRALHAQATTTGETILVDGYGRAAGILTDRTSP